MKKYKLIKEYPGSPEINTILEQRAENVFYCSNNSNFFRHKNELENYPEFWELVVEKDYEILSFKTNHNIYTKDKNNIFRSINVNDSADRINMRTESYMLKSSVIYKIYQVKRLSDNERFTIGDSVDGLGIHDKNLKITHIKIKDDNSDVMFFNNGVYFQNLSTVKKSKKPLFTTEDGVDIFEADETFYVNIQKHSNFNIYHNEPFSDRKNSKKLIKNKVGLYFSTKEAAEEYVLMNKPCLSLNDVEKAFKKRRTTHTILGELKEIVNTKING